jgi:cobalt-zinc-cadmium efflux system outer membrane protein
MKSTLFSFALLLSAYFSNARDLQKQYGSDTLYLTIEKAETLFLNQNLDLIAQKYSIDSAKATIITAKLYDNPEFAYSNSFYNARDKQFFNPEMNIQVSQLIKLAGKRNKSIALAQSGVDITNFQFYDLLRTLKYVLRNDFYNIYFLQQSSKLYDLEIASLQKLVLAFEEQVQKGFAAPKDLLRIKSELYTLQAEHDDLLSGIDNLQSELKLLIKVSPTIYIVPDADISSLNKGIVSQSSYQNLLDSAIANRPDLKVLNATILFSNNNLKLQQAYATPDLTLIASYDRQGGFVPDYNSIGIGIPLPFFNRNQGNIKNAKIEVAQNKIQYESGLEKIKSEVSNNYITALRTEKTLLSFDPNFDADIKHLIEEVFLAFQKKNITMLEFLDFYDSYKLNVLQLNKLRFNKISALEQLNFSIGKDFFNLSN